MSNSILIHKKNDEGIADFIRGSLLLYAICRMNNTKYYINFENYPYLKQSFNIDNIHIPNVNKNEINLMSYIGKSCFCDNIVKKLSTILEQTGIYETASNIIEKNKNDLIMKFKNDYFLKVLVPSNNILNKIKNIYFKYGLSENNYISVHVRCGDYNLEKNTKATSKRSDRRFDVGGKLRHFMKINIAVMKFMKDNNLNIPIVLHSDSKAFKEKMLGINKTYICLDLKIEHTGHSSEYNTAESYFDTIAEFYIISKSRYILLLNKYSGFSHIASLIENKPLYVNFESEIFNHLHCNNIKKLI